MAVPHPIPYQGSKRRLAPTILQFFPSVIDRLIEPFAGSAAITLAAIHGGCADRVVLNDANAPLMALWRSIVQEPHVLADQYAALWHAQHDDPAAFYKQVRAEFNRTHAPDRLLFLLARCVKAAVRYNAQGAFNQSADRRRLGTRPDSMRAQIVAAAHLLHDRTRLVCDDYRTILHAATPHDLIYLDPPYQGVSGARDPRYLHGLKATAFAAELHDLNQRHVPYLVSYDGRTDAKAFGSPLSPALNLLRIEIAAGRSSQATLLGRAAHTYESLYLSPALVDRLAAELPNLLSTPPIFGKMCTPTQAL